MGTISSFWIVSMFAKNSQNVVLIGEPYKTKEQFSLYDSKIGGLPVYTLELNNG